MPKIPVRMFRLPTLTLEGHPWKSEEDKFSWINFQFDGAPFVLDDLAILETGRYLRAKSTHKTGEGKTRFQFKGVPEKAMVPGLHLYDADWPVRRERKAYFVPLGAQNQTVKATKGKIQGALLPPDGLEVELRKHDAEGGKFLLVASARKDFPCLTGQIYTVIPDGEDPVDVALVTSGTLEPRDLSDFVKKTFRFPGLPTVNALYSISLRVFGYVVLPPPLFDEEFEETHGNDAVRIMTKAWTHFAKKARNAAAQPGGILNSELQTKMALPEAVFSFLTKKLVADGQLKVREDYFLPTDAPDTYLSPIAKKALEQLEEAGAEGIDLDHVTSSLFQKTYQDLARMDLAVKTETPVVYGLVGWKSLRNTLCGAGTLGKEWRIADVKDVLGTSRKPLLGILNALEAEGWLERRDDHRKVIREATAESPVGPRFPVTTKEHNSTAD